MAQQKLYTEKQVKDILSGFMEKHFIDEFLEKYYTPIELPSDEEIEQGLFHQSNEYAYGYKDAFEIIRSQIKNK